LKTGEPFGFRGGKQLRDFSVGNRQRKRRFVEKQASLPEEGKTFGGLGKLLSGNCLGEEEGGDSVAEGEKSSIACERTAGRRTRKKTERDRPYYVKGNFMR